MRLGLLRVGLIMPLLCNQIAAQTNPPVPQRMEAAPPDQMSDIMDRAKERFDRIGRGRGTGYKPYMRGEDFAVPRSYPSGDLVNTTALSWLNHFRSRRSPEFLDS